MWFVELVLHVHLKSEEIEMFEGNAVVAIYDTHAGAERAVKALQRAGIDMHTMSIIGKDSHTDVSVS
jgi:hypothetical protein